MRDLGNCPLIMFEMLFGSRHLNSMRLMSPATRPAVNGALRGAVVRVCGSFSGGPFPGRFGA